LCVDTEQDKHDEAVADACAVALASLDRRACARVQMRDANTILEQLVLPISFPWSQCKDILYKPLPRDIDEMSIIMHGDEECSVIELNNETFRALKDDNVPKKIPIHLHKTEDPGVLELQTYNKPTASRLRRFKRLYSTKTQKTQSSEDAMMNGECSLQMYHEVQLKKRRREQFDELNTTKQRISFRVGCTSSRSKIFTQAELFNGPLFLQAIYPKLIQDGVKKSGLEAYEEGIRYGSYNSRPLPSKDSVMNDPTSKNRFFVGRTRLVWSEKERLQSKSQRSPYCSILTRQRIEGNALKRPLTVRVGIRLNGVLVSARQSQEIVSKSGTTAITPDSTYSHTAKSVNEALDLACNIEEKQTTVEIQEYKIIPPLDYSQCTLNLPVFVNEIKQNCSKENRKSLTAIDQIRKQITFHRELSLYRSESQAKDTSVKCNLLYRMRREDEIVDPRLGTVKPECTEFIHGGVKFQHHCNLKFSLEAIPPRLDCLPTEDGLIHVSCTLPGKIVLRHEIDYDTTCNQLAPFTEPLLTLSLLLNVFSNEVDRCPGCWNYRAGDLMCSNCDYESSLPLIDGNVWIDTTGSFWRKLDAKPPEWIYATVDETKQPYKNTKWYMDDSCCHLCGKGTTTGSTTVSLCAAEGCNVRFHPVCAIIASALSEATFRHGDCDTSRGSNISSYQHFSNHQRYGNDDAYLCTQYSHSLVETSFTTTHTTQSNVDNHHKKKPKSCDTEAHGGRDIHPMKRNGSSGTAPHSTTTAVAATAAAANATFGAAETIPLMYCPYHNPKRCRDYYGWYPLGCHFNHETIRIPPQRDYRT
jgi:hypothetical protein